MEEASVNEVKVKIKYSHKIEHVLHYHLGQGGAMGRAYHITRTAIHTAVLGFELRVYNNWDAL